MSESSLSDALRLCERIVRVSQLQHHRALYFKRLRDVEKRLRASIVALAGGDDQSTLEALEAALRSVDPAWLAFRHLLAQTYFMPLALVCVALLSRCATLLAEAHASVSRRCAGSERRRPQRNPPRLLALAPPPPGATADAALERLFGGTPAATPPAHATSSTEAGAPHAAAAGASPRSAGEVAGCGLEDEDVGEPTEATAAESLGFYVDVAPAGPSASADQSAAGGVQTGRTEGPAAAPAAAAAEEMAYEEGEEGEEEGEDEAPARALGKQRRGAKRAGVRSGGRARRKPAAKGVGQLLALGSLLHAQLHGADAACASMETARDEARALAAGGRLLESISAWRGVVAQQPGRADAGVEGECGVSFDDMYSLAAACEAYAATAERGADELAAADGCARRAFRAAAALAASERAFAIGGSAAPRRHSPDGSPDGEDEPMDAVLSEACPHIRRADVSFILPYVQHQLTPTATNASWRSLFNMAPARLPRARGDERATAGDAAARPWHKVFGLGLSKTGVTSLRAALATLGWGRATAMDLEFYARALDRMAPNATLRAARGDTRALSPLLQFLDGSDASTDLPLALFPTELHHAFPSALFILTTREPQAWWASAARQMATAYTFSSPLGRNRAVAYGHPTPHAGLYVKRFVSHALEVMRSVPCERLLLLDIIGGEGWQKLGDFLRVETPRDGTPFPHGQPVPTPENAPPTTQRARRSRSRSRS